MYLHYIVDIIIFFILIGYVTYNTKKIEIKHKEEIKKWSDLLRSLEEQHISKMKEWDSLFRQQHKTFDRLTAAYASQIKTFRSLYESLTKGWRTAFDEMFNKHNESMEKAKSLIEHLTEQKLINPKYIDNEIKH